MEPPSRNGRPYGLPNGPASGLRPGGRPPPVQPPPPSSSASSRTFMNRAEIFEDEKRRIIESCFAKVETNGQLVESYITHIRIVEDSVYQASPPPPTSDRQNKKERVIVLAVRSTGRIQVHKARENTTGTFSVGKVWEFADLSAIGSFSARDAENEQVIQWADPGGFTVTIKKPYYWQASSPKEKEFFIASLLKIYKKYTQGELPKLTGFSAAELEKVLGESSQQSRSTPSSVSSGPIQRGRSPLNQGSLPPSRPTPSPDSAFTQPRSSPPTAKQPPPGSRGPPFPGQDRLLDNRRPSGTDQRAPQGYAVPPDALRPGQLRQPPSREQVRPYPGQTPPDRLTPQSSQSDFAPNRTGTPDSLQIGAATNRRGGIFQGRPDGIRSREPSPSDALGISGSNPETRRFNGNLVTHAQANDSSDSLLSQPRAPVPERKRPPMNSPPPTESGFGALSKPSSLRVGRPAIVGSPENAPRSLPTAESMPGAFISTPTLTPSDADEKKGLLPRIASPPPMADIGLVKSEPPTTEVSKPDISLSENPVQEDEEKKAAEDLARPGLGRMFGANKKTTKDLFKSAATAYTVFKPRAGGAAAKLFAAENKSNEPDGITGVVPAPSLVRTKTNESARTQGSQDPSSIQATPTSVKGKDPVFPSTKSKEPQLPDVKVTSPKSPYDGPAPVVAVTSAATLMSDSIAQQKAKAAEEETARRKLRRTPQQSKYLETLGVDPALLEGRGLAFESLLDEFWPPSVWHSKSAETLQAEIRREMAQVQAGSWLEHLERHDEQRAAVKDLLDKSIEEVDVLDKLLTLYSVEMGSLTEDIAYIEAQGQGLQVQTANQKLLQAELQNLLETINISSQQLNHLRNGNIISIEGLESTERAVLALYKALLLMDPSIKQNTDTSSQQAVEYQALSKMRALQEKKISYVNESASFLIRLRNYMDISYGQAGLEVETSVKSRTSTENSNAKLTVGDLDVGRSILWKYSPLMLYAKELDGNAWKELMQSYQLKMRPLYSDTLLDTIQGYKKMARGSPGDEQELLFTLNDNQLEGLAATTRKLTVKRSGTLARTFRAGSGEKASRTAGARNGSLLPCEAFAEALDEMAPLILTEQNFVVDFFHASTTETLDFAETVQAALPESRRALHSLTRKGYEPDQAMIQLVTGVLSDLFSFLPNELQNLVNWAINMGPLQGVGILHALYHVMASLDDNYFFRTLYGLVTRITSDWSRFMDEQIRAIEDTKVKIKKRKGVIYFMKVFPSFSAHVENMLPSASGANGEVRALVDQAYERLNKAMFESLRVIAKESPSNAPHGGAGDPEDKEALNYHILLIENMNHYVEYVDDRGDRVLEQGRQKAKEELEDHLSLYVDAVIRRPLGKLMDFTESLNHAVEGLGSHSSISHLASKPTFSTQNFKKLIAANDAKELRRGVDALRRRVEKHFGDADEQDTSRNLVNKVLASCEERFAQEIEKVQTIPKVVYGDDFIQLQVTRDDLYRFFKGGR